MTANVTGTGLNIKVCASFAEIDLESHMIVLLSDLLAFVLIPSDKDLL